MSRFNWGQPLLSKKGKERRRITKEVSRTTVECDTLCCYCLCILMNLVILALYKVLAGLYKKAWKQHHLLKMKKKAFILHNNSEGSWLR